MNGNNDKLRGIVARIVMDKETGQRKGFGFLKDEATGEEYFFHVSSLEMTTKRFDEIQEKDRAEWTAIDGPKGPRAVDVRLL